MLEQFKVQNYLIIQSNVVINNCLWDGDTKIWTPPIGSIALIQSEIPAKIWVLNKDTNTYVFAEKLGAGDIGFTWDGSTLTTNQPQPEPPIQPVSTGTQSI